LRLAEKIFPLLRKLPELKARIPHACSRLVICYLTGFEASFLETLGIEHGGADVIIFPPLLRFGDCCRTNPVLNGNIWKSVKINSKVFSDTDILTFATLNGKTPGPIADARPSASSAQKQEKFQALHHLLK